MIELVTPGYVLHRTPGPLATCLTMLVLAAVLGFLAAVVLLR